MAQSPPPRGGSPSVIPLKRTLEDAHTPSISSPLNPNPPRPNAAPTREPRSKKESLKKREASGTSAKPAVPEKGVKSKKFKDSDDQALAISPIRYNHALPSAAFQYTNRPTGFASREGDPMYAPDGTELKKPIDHIINKKGFAYSACIADSKFQHSHYYRNTDATPYQARMSRADSDKHFYFDERTARTVTNERGWRMSRANVYAREGTFYYEVKIHKGVPPDGSPESMQASTNGPLPHVRMGWARREAPGDTPVGFDGYSYGVTDMRLEPMHKSRASKFLDDGDDAAIAVAAKKKVSKKKPAQILKDTTSFTANDHARTGDVIGLSITLPPLTLHRKIASGIYNPLVDTGAGTNTSAFPSEGAPNIIRDRVPVEYRGNMYFENLDYKSSKGMEGYGDRGPFAKETPSTNHDDPTLRSLPGSSIKVWKNGKRIGTAFRNLMAFLPPCSILDAVGTKGNAKTVADDGFVGYFPVVSAFSEAVAEVNFGPNFWFPPDELAAPVSRQTKGPDAGTLTGGLEEAQNADGKQDKGQAGEDVIMEGTEGPPASALPKKPSHTGTPGGPSLRGMHERYEEQVAEDIVYDLVDEVDFFMQDGGSLEEIEEESKGRVKKEEPH